MVYTSYIKKMVKLCRNLKWYCMKGWRKMKTLKEFKEEQLESVEFRKEYESIQTEMEDILVELENEINRSNSIDLR